MEKNQLFLQLKSIKINVQENQLQVCEVNCRSPLLYFFPPQKYPLNRTFLIFYDDWFRNTEPYSNTFKKTKGSVLRRSARLDGQDSMCIGRGRESEFQKRQVNCSKTKYESKVMPVSEEQIRMAAGQQDVGP